MFSQVIKKLGPIKNELLIFAILCDVIVHSVAASICHSSDSWMRVCGVGMHIIGVIWILSFASFYTYAVLFLPSSEQELLFSENARKTLAKHTTRKKTI